MKKLLCLLLTAVLLLSMIAVTFCAAEVDTADESAQIEAADEAAQINAVSEGAASGTTGDCTWTLDGTTVTISGTGRMADYGTFGNTKTWGTDITKVIVKKGVTHIGSNAFFDCAKLTSVSIADSVTSLGDNVFFNCKALEHVSLPDSVTEIGESMFDFCDSLTSFTFPASVTSVSEDMFWQCTNLTSVTLGSSIESIGDSAFSGCTNLRSVNIPDSVISIGEYAFYHCYNLTDFKLGSSVKRIGYSAFEECRSLGLTVIPDSLISIGQYAFYGADVASSVYDNVKYIGKVAYTLTNGSARTITIKEGTLGLRDYLAFADDELVSVSIPDTVVHIGKNAFCSCDRLSEITIPDSVKSIDDMAFLGCPSMTSVTIPASVTEIGKWAFGYSGSTYTTKTLIEGFVIYGCAGTEAERYAEENGIAFVALSDDPEPTEPPAQSPTEIPTEPTQPVDPTEPTQPVNPTEPAEPTEPTEPTGPIDPDAPRFEVSDVKAMAGEEVSVTLSVHNNPGITALSVQVSYPEQLTLTSVDYTTPFSAKASGSNRMQSPFTVSWYSPSSENENADGVFAALTFRVADEAEVGTYPITLTYNEDNVFDNTFRNIAFAVKSGTLTVYDHIAGDINGDAKVNMKDLVLLQQYINGWDVDVDERFADVNGDGSVNMKDLVLLQQFINGWEVELQ